MLRRFQTDTFKTWMNYQLLLHCLLCWVARAFTSQMENKADYSWKQQWLTRLCCWWAEWKLGYYTNCVPESKTTTQAWMTSLLQSNLSIWRKCQMSTCQIVQMSNLPNVKSSKCQIVQMLNRPNVKSFKCQIVQMSNRPNVKSSKCQLVKMSNRPNVRDREGDMGQEVWLYLRCFQQKPGYPMFSSDIQCSPLREHC